MARLRAAIAAGTNAALIGSHQTGKRMAWPAAPATNACTTSGWIGASGAKRTYSATANAAVIWAIRARTRGTPRLVPVARAVHIKCSLLWIAGIEQLRVDVLRLFHLERAAVVSGDILGLLVHHDDADSAVH